MELIAIILIIILIGLKDPFDKNERDDFNPLD